MEYEINHESSDFFFLLFIPSFLPNNKAHLLQNQCFRVISQHITEKLRTFFYQET